MDFIVVDGIAYSLVNSIYSFKLPCAGCSFLSEDYKTLCAIDELKIKKCYFQSGTVYEKDLKKTRELKIISIL